MSESLQGKSSGKIETDSRNSVLFLPHTDGDTAYLPFDYRHPPNRDVEVYDSDPKYMAFVLLKPTTHVDLLVSGQDRTIGAGDTAQMSTAAITGDPSVVVVPMCTLKDHLQGQCASHHYHQLINENGETQEFHIACAHMAAHRFDVYKSMLAEQAAIEERNPGTSKFVFFEISMIEAPYIASKIRMQVILVATSIREVLRTKVSYRPSYSAPDCFRSVISVGDAHTHNRVRSTTESQGGKRVYTHAPVQIMSPGPCDTVYGTGIALEPLMVSYDCPEFETLSQSDQRANLRFRDYLLDGVNKGVTHQAPDVSYMRLRPMHPKYAIPGNTDAARFIANMFESPLSAGGVMVDHCNLGKLVLGILRAIRRGLEPTPEAYPYGRGERRDEPPVIVCTQSGVDGSLAMQLDSCINTSPRVCFKTTRTTTKVPAGFPHIDISRSTCPGTLPLQPELHELFASVIRTYHLPVTLADGATCLVAGAAYRVLVGKALRKKLSISSPYSLGVANLCTDTPTDVLACLQKLFPPSLPSGHTCVRVPCGWTQSRDIFTYDCGVSVLANVQAWGRWIAVTSHGARFTLQPTAVARELHSIAVQPAGFAAVGPYGAANGVSLRYRGKWRNSQIALALGRQVTPFLPSAGIWSEIMSYLIPTHYVANSVVRLSALESCGISANVPPNAAPTIIAMTSGCRVRIECVSNTQFTRDAFMWALSRRTKACGAGVLSPANATVIPDQVRATCFTTYAGHPTNNRTLRGGDPYLTQGVSSAWPQRATGPVSQLSWHGVTIYGISDSTCGHLCDAEYVGTICTIPIYVPPYPRSAAYPSQHVSMTIAFPRVAIVDDWIYDKTLKGLRAPGNLDPRGVALQVIEAGVHELSAVTGADVVLLRTSAIMAHMVLEAGLYASTFHRGGLGFAAPLYLVGEVCRACLITLVHSGTPDPHGQGFGLDHPPLVQMFSDGYHYRHAAHSSSVTPFVSARFPVSDMVVRIITHAAIRLGDPNQDLGMDEISSDELIEPHFLNGDYRPLTRIAWRVMQRRGHVLSQGQIASKYCPVGGCMLGISTDVCSGQGLSNRIMRAATSGAVDIRMSAGIRGLADVRVIADAMRRTTLTYAPLLKDVYYKDLTGQLVSKVTKSTFKTVSLDISGHALTASQVIHREAVWMDFSEEMLNVAAGGKKTVVSVSEARDPSPYHTCFEYLAALFLLSIYDHTNLTEAAMTYAIRYAESIGLCDPYEFKPFMWSLAICHNTCLQALVAADLVCYEGGEFERIIKRANLIADTMTLACDRHLVEWNSMSVPF